MSTHTGMSWTRPKSSTPSSASRTRCAVAANGRYLKSTFSSANGGCLSFTVADGLVGFQDDKLAPAERKAHTLIFTQPELAAFIAGAKNGDFDHLLDPTSPQKLSYPSRSALRPACLVVDRGRRQRLVVPTRLDTNPDRDRIDDVRIASSTAMVST